MRIRPLPEDQRPSEPSAPAVEPVVAPMAVRWGLWIATAVVVLEAVRALLAPSAPTSAVRWVYEAALMLSATVCVVRAARVRDERWVWGLLGSGLWLWAAGGAYYMLAVVGTVPEPIVSLSDALSVGWYPFAFASLVLLARSRIGGLRRSASLDGVMVGLGATAVLAAVLLDDVVAAAGAAGGVAGFAKLAYPLGDLALVGVVVGVLVAAGRPPGRTWGLIALGSVAFATSDLVWVYGVARTSFVPGTITDIGWYAGPALLAWAAWSPPARMRTATSGWQYGILPLLTGLVVLAILAYDELPGVDVNGVGMACAAAAVLVVTVRLALMFRENAQLLTASDRLAHTDGLTGLGNRRQLVGDLEARLRADGGAFALALFDLNGFKSYNDTFGHLPGDELLARLGRRLQAAVGDHGTAYRMGGDEFCVLLPRCGASGFSVLRSVAGALTETGEGFEVTCAMGVVELPSEASTASEALRAADKRMYADKRGDRASVKRQTSEVLIRALNVHDNTLGLHAGRVAALAGRVAEDLGLATAETRELELAARLHDVGKLAIPDAILDKPGPLTDDEWRFIHQHTAIGEHILEGAPALARLAPIVRASHERVDGTGYPDGLAGDAIPLASRIILACDAYDAMTDARPYNKAVSTPQAIAELRRGAGTQFDARVVESLAALIERDDRERVDRQPDVDPARRPGSRAR
jgi:two-component system cell cycle response regulator